MDQPAAKYEGWTLVELFGHQREAGYVTTQYFGDRAMFQIDIPEIPARQETLKRPQWSDRTEDGLIPAGAVIEKDAIQGRTRFVSPGAVYALNPATEQAVREAIAASERRAWRVISLPEQRQLPASDTTTITDPEEAMEPEEEYDQSADNEYDDDRMPL